MKLYEVLDDRTAHEFIRANVELNRNNPNYIRPLDKDIEEVFDRKKNKSFRSGDAIRWILKDDQGRLAGRIAAFVNKRYRNKGDDIPVGGIGFFDCVNDAAAASLLLDTAKTWLTEKGMQAMDGPINFGERDRWWGLLVEGFQPPIYCLNYNPPYYKELFEQYGFREFYNQICFGLDPKAKLADKLFARHRQLAADPQLRAQHLDNKHLDKFALDFAAVYNQAWAGHGGAKQMAPAAAQKLFRSMKPVMDERINWFVYYNNEPIAMYINLPDLNQWFKYLNGKFGLLQRLQFLWIKRTRPCNRFCGLVFGVVPQWQAKGIDSYMIIEAAKMVQSPEVPYTEYEMQWVGDFNPKMMNVLHSMGDTFPSRRLVTYRYLFDRNKPFQRHPMV